MLDRAGDDTVGEAGERAGGIVLAVGESGAEGGRAGIEEFEVAAGRVEAGELDGYLVIVTGSIWVIGTPKGEG